jgi:flagellar basal body-associated protein FliL
MTDGELLGGTEPKGRFATLRIALVRAVAGRRRRSIAMISATVALAALAVGSLIVLGDGGHQDVTIELGGPLVFHPMPEFLADLRPAGGRTPHLRLAIVVQTTEDDAAEIERRQVELMAAIQLELRDMSQADLVGREGAERLRGVLRDAINREIAPAQVRTVLFTQFLLD